MILSFQAHKEESQKVFLSSNDTGIPGLCLYKDFVSFEEEKVNFVPSYLFPSVIRAWL